MQEFLSQIPQNALLLSLFAAAFLESLLLIGLVIPGVAILFGLAAIATEQGLAPSMILFAIGTGALCGDLISFFLGRYASKPLLNSQWLKSHSLWQTRGTEFFERYGIFSVAIGRFIGPLRPFVPFLAGSLKMPALYFISTSVLTTIIWAPVYGLPGIFSVELLDWAYTQFGILLEVIATISIAIAAFVIGHRLLVSGQNPLLPAILSFALLCVISLLVLLQLQGQLQAHNQQLYLALFESTHSSSTLLLIAETITRFGDTLFVLSWSVIVFVWLYRDSKKHAFIWLGLLLSSKLCNSVMKLIMAVPRPENGSFLSTYSFPSGHSSAAAALLMMTAVIMAMGETARFRRVIYAAALTLALLVALSRVLLGLHWPLDVITGWCVGAVFATLLRCYWPIDLKLHKKSQLVTGLALVTLSYQLTSVYFS